MHQYYYVNSKRNGQQYDHQWSGRVYPTGRMSTVEIESFDLMDPPFNWISPVDQKVVAAKHNYGNTSHGQIENSMQPGVYNDWELQKQSANWAQPLNHKGMSAQGHYQSLAPSASPSGFNPHKQPLPWAQPVNHMGMFGQGNPTANPFGFGPNGQQANLGGFGNPTGWTGQVNPMGWGGPGSLMGWGNNVGNGRPGIFGNLLNLGKGTMNGIGIISSLIGMGKFLF